MKCDIVHIFSRTSRVLLSLFMLSTTVVLPADDLPKQPKKNNTSFLRNVFRKTYRVGRFCKEHPFVTTSFVVAACVPLLACRTEQSDSCQCSNNTTSANPLSTCSDSSNTNVPINQTNTHPAAMGTTVIHHHHHHQSRGGSGTGAFAAGTLASLLTNPSILSSLGLGVIGLTNTALAYQTHENTCEIQEQLREAQATLDTTREELGQARAENIWLHAEAREENRRLHAGARAENRRLHHRTRSQIHSLDKKNTHAHAKTYKAINEAQKENTQEHLVTRNQLHETTQLLAAQMQQNTVDLQETLGNNHSDALAKVQELEAQIAQSTSNLKSNLDKLGRFNILAHLSVKRKIFTMHSEQQQNAANINKRLDQQQENSEILGQKMDAMLSKQDATMSEQHRQSRFIGMPGVLMYQGSSAPKQSLLKIKTEVQQN